MAASKGLEQAKDARENAGGYENQTAARIRARFKRSLTKLSIMRSFSPVSASRKRIESHQDEGDDPSNRGALPGPPTGGGSRRGTRTLSGRRPATHEAALRKFYARVAPEKNDDDTVGLILTKFKGREDDMYAVLAKMYPGEAIVRCRESV